MYSLTFLNSQDISQLKVKLEQKLLAWSANHTYSENFSVDIYAVRYKDFQEKKGNVYTTNNRMAALVCEKNIDFQWPTLIFSELLEHCPRDARFNSIIKSVRTTFFQDILKVNIDDRSADSVTFISIDAYLHVQIKNKDNIVVDVYAPHGFFLQHIDKKISPASRQGLASRESAINNVKVPTHFSFNFGSIDFSDILKLESGTVLRSSQKIDNTFQMKFRDDSIATVSMGKLTNNLAFYIKGR